MKYSLACTTWNDDEVEAAYKVLKSGNCTMGVITKQCEEKFAKKVGRKYCIMSNSGSSANLLMVAALRYHSKYNLPEGAEVIVPAVSWSTTYAPLQQYGLKLKFVDIDIQTLNINIDDLENAITPNTKAILAVNLLGVPNNFIKLQQLCKEHNLLLLLDNCESMGSTYKDIETSEYALMTTYSGFFSHHICLVEAGFTVTDDEELYQLMISLRAHGWSRGLPDKNFLCDKTGDPFVDSFKFLIPGYNLRPNDIFSAIGLLQIDKLDTFIEQRRQNHKYFVEKYIQFINDLEFDGKEAPFFIQNSEAYSSPSWFGFALVLANQLTGKRKDVTKLLSEHNIDSRPIVAGNFCKNPVIKFMDYEIVGELPAASKIDEDGLFIGNSHTNLKKEIDYFFEIIHKIL